MKMKFLRTSIVILTLATVIVTGKEVEDLVEIPTEYKCGDNVDHLVDKLIVEAKEQFSGKTPLEDRDGTVELTNGYISGINRLSRVGPVNLECNGKNASALGIIRVIEIKGSYDWSTSIFGRKLSGSAALIAEELDLKFVVSQLRGFGNKPQLDELKVTDVQGVRIEVSGLGRLSSALSRVSSVISNVFKRSVSKVFVKKIRSMVVKELSEVSYPIE